ncbi:hypothetical protein AMJ85_02455, partial [candidate division BRC1 bacterium SM23_51]
VATHDWSNCRVLERLFMYEQRIERSLFKNLAELERLRLLRELKQAEDADEELAIPEASGFEAATRRPALAGNSKHPSFRRGKLVPVKTGIRNPKQADSKEHNYAKRTQFPPDRADVSSFPIRDYENKPPQDLREDKRKQSQSHTAARTKGAGKTEKLPGAPAH